MPRNWPKNVAVWTEFELPLTDEMKDDDEGWRRIFKPLIEAPGHCGSKWGRIRERPSWVKLVTLWEAWTYMDEFNASPGYDTYQAGISTISEPRIQGKYMTGVNNVWFRELQPGLALYQVYLPTPVTEPQRERLNKIRSLRPAAPGWTNQHEHPMRCLPIKFWAVDTVERDGREMQPFIWLHYWKSAEREERYKRGRREVLDEGGLIVGKLGVMEHFAMQLEKVGVVRWTEEHCDLKPVPKRSMTLGEAIELRREQAQ